MTGRTLSPRFRAVKRAAGRPAARGRRTTAQTPPALRLDGRPSSSPTRRPLTRFARASPILPGGCVDPLSTPLPWALLVACAFASRHLKRARRRGSQANLLFSAPEHHGAIRDFVNEWNRRYSSRRTSRARRDLDGLDHEAELRYLSPPTSRSARWGKLRVESRQEYLPRISQRIELRTNVFRCRLHVGATYYLAPTTGDFRARAYSARVLSATNSKVSSSSSSSTPTPSHARRRADHGPRDAPAYYLEMGGTCGSRPALVMLRHLPSMTCACCATRRRVLPEARDPHPPIDRVARSERLASIRGSVRL